jgi:hypothetical protein
MTVRLRLVPLVCALAALVSVREAGAADPGTPYPASAEVSDQKAGAVLVYPYYTSSSSSPNSQNTRINITQTDAAAVAVHLFFVSNSGVADSFICLASKQTASFVASDIDPNVSGYLLAVAVDVNGCPVGNNTLIGDASVKLASGHSSSLNAYAVAALFSGTLAGCTAQSGTANVNLDGTAYNRAPRTVAIDKIRSRADGNDTLLVLNRLGGNLATSTLPAIGALSGSVFDGAGTAYPFTENIATTQFRSSLSNTFPVTVPPFNSVIPAGITGWMKMAGDTDIGLLGAVLNFNANAAASAGAFNGGHGLRTLTVTPAASYVIPVFPPNC